MSRDPIWEKGGLNVFSFARGEPVNSVDADGRKDCGYFELYESQPTVDGRIGYTVHFKRFTEDCGCKGTVILVQATRRRGNTIIDASNDEFKSNRRTPGGIPIPPYPNSDDDEFSDSPDLSGNALTWEMEVCAVCRVTGAPDVPCCCVTFSFKDPGYGAKGSRELIVPGVDKLPSGKYRLPCSGPTDLWKTAVRNWQTDAGSRVGK